MQLRMTPHRIQRLIEVGRQKTLREAEMQETTIENNIPSLIYVTNKKRSRDDAVNILATIQEQVPDLEVSTIRSDLTSNTPDKRACDYEDEEEVLQKFNEMIEKFLAQQQNMFEKLLEVFRTFIELAIEYVNSQAIEERPAKKRRRTR